MNRLNEQSFIASTSKLNMAIANLLEQIINYFRGIPLYLFFKMSYLQIFYDFTSIKNILLRKQEAFKKICFLTERIFNSYCLAWKNNSLLPFESLFDFTSEERISNMMSGNQDILNGLEIDNGLDPVPQNKNKNELNLGDLKDELTKMFDDTEAFVQRKNWREQEDIVLVQNFENVVCSENIYLSLQKILRGSLNSNKTILEIKKRVKFLNLGSQSEQNVLIKIQTIHGSKFNYRNVLNHLFNSCSKELLQSHFEVFSKLIKNSIKNLKIFREDNPLEEFALVPQTDQEFKSLYIFQRILIAIDLINPDDRKAFWRFPNYVKEEELHDRFERFEEVFDLMMRGKDISTSNNHKIDKEFNDLLEQNHLEIDYKPDSKQNKKPKRKLRKITKKSSNQIELENSDVTLSDSEDIKSLSQLKNKNIANHNDDIAQDLNKSDNGHIIQDKTSQSNNIEIDFDDLDKPKKKLSRLKKIKN